MRLAGEDAIRSGLGEGTAAVSWHDQIQPQKDREDFSAAHRFHSAADMLY